ncbi:MAG: hypothetical protein ACFE9S_19305 [Candidatus Hermodarchaeota archaeon]
MKKEKLENLIGWIKQPKKFKSIISLGVFIVLSATFLSLSFVFGKNNTNILEGNYNQVEYLYQESYICNNTYRYGGIWFTHENYFQVIWRNIGMNTYTLNLAMNSRNRVPTVYIFVNPVNTYTIQGEITFNGIKYDVYDGGSILSHDWIEITTFEIFLEQYPISLNLNCSNTHNSDLGNVTATGTIFDQIKISIPSNYFLFYGIFVLLTAFSIIAAISIAGLLCKNYYRKIMKIKESIKEK